VCLTVIGLIRVVVATINVDTIADNLLAVDALLFLASCLLSYWALRTRSIRRMYRVERVADAIFRHRHAADDRRLQHHRLRGAVGASFAASDGGVSKPLVLRRCEAVKP
jgi:hypothetical protein